MCFLHEHFIDTFNIGQEYCFRSQYLLCFCFGIIRLRHVTVMIVSTLSLTTVNSACYLHLPGWYVLFIGILLYRSILNAVICCHF